MMHKAVRKSDSDSDLHQAGFAGKDPVSDADSAVPESPVGVPRYLSWASRVTGDADPAKGNGSAGLNPEVAPADDPAETVAHRVASSVSGRGMPRDTGHPDNRRAGPWTARALEAQGAGAPFPTAARTRIEPVTGWDLSTVRIHSGRESTLAAAELGARAFTYGKDIWLGSERARTDLGLLAHEAAHTHDSRHRAAPQLFLDRIDDIIDEYHDYGGLNLREEALGAHLAGRIRDRDVNTASRVLRRLNEGDRGQVAAATVAALSDDDRASLGEDPDGAAFHDAVSDAMISAHTEWLDLAEDALGVTIAGHIRSYRFDLARQTINRLAPGSRDEVAKAVYDELTLPELRVLAASIEGADLAHTLLDAMSGGWETDDETAAISVLAETVLNERDAIIPIIGFVALIRQVERQYPDDGPEETLTRIRQEYYPGGDYIPLAFDNLIPDAPRTERYETTGVFGEPESHRRRRNLAHMPDRENREYSHGLLTSHATENDPEGGDNPSPYIELAGGEKVDVGHFLLGLDALIHPRAGSPYAEYGMSNIDPSSWVADIGIAVVWHDRHVDEGEAPGGVPPNAPDTPDFDQYYRMSAPIEDLISDVDSFGAHQSWQDSGGARLSQVLEEYYIGVAGTGDTSGVSYRWRTFCTANGFGYTESGGRITWDAALRARLITRVDNFNDMFAGGSFQGLLSMTAGTTASRRNWPSTPRAVDRFLAWVQTGLEAELARNPAR